MTAARSARLPRPDVESRRSMLLGVVNGSLHQGGDGFIDGTTVVPVLLSRLTSSNALIGLVSSFSDLGWLLPQFLVAPWLARYPYQLWLYRRAAWVRGLALALLAALAFPLATHRHALLAAFVVCYGTYAFGAGLSGVSFMDVVGKTVPREHLGRFWAQRLFWGGSIAAAAGLAVREVLKLPSASLQYLLLFGLATVLVSTAYALFGSIHEPAGIPDPETARLTPLALLREGLEMLRGRGPFRDLLLSRGTLALWYTAGPFMVLFAARPLGGGARAAGTFLLARVAGMVLANLAWQRLARTHGSRALMRTGTLAIAGTTFAAALVAAASPWWLAWIPATGAIVALEALAFLGGASQSAILIGWGSLLIELAPPGRRHSFIGLANTLIGPAMLLPMIGGALVDLINAPVVFVLCSAAALFGYRAAVRLPDTRPAPAAAVPFSPEPAGRGGGA